MVTEESPTALTGATLQGSERILVATDGGSASSAAIRWLIDHVGHRADRIALVGVTAPGASAAELSHLERRLLGQKRLLQAVLTSAEVVHSLRTGRAAEVFSAASGALDLVVIGTHHRSRSHPLTRGLPQRLAQASRCSVVVVPSEWISSPGPVVVSLAVDSASDAALTFAQTEALRAGTALTLAHVWDMPGVGIAPLEGDPDIENIPDRQRRAMARALAWAQQRVPTVTVRQEVRQGKLVPTLVDIAHDATLLVIGRPRRSALSRELLGSVARDVLAAPPCPVAIVP